MSFEEWLQSRLTAHGYPVGEIDGIVGPVTRTAIRQFQEDRDLEITGTATAETVMWLRRSSVGDVPRPPEDPAAGPDPSLRWPTQAEVPGFYGMIGMSQQRLRLPYPMRLSWNRAILIDSISVHSLVLESAGRALEMIASMYSPLQRTELGLDIFGGSLNVRQVRGGTAWSMHSWGKP